ncbi:DNA-directed DNA polymerase eta rad30 [Pichia californica]|uniref:DNA-directed DNA polymerase eta rad30 n=1 Tax=Pichia californica TaxID=460514 RepID=A0A9P6WM69_9ASCO|nr:DNA-directed DNA polymerase eta rad30 [[Candida] californica]
MALLKFRKESKFKYRNLLDLNDSKKAFNSPLSVICHIDLNAFFAQCEQLRLGLSDNDPVVCVQWNTLIAVSYAARDYGVTRMDRLEQAKLKCPNLIPAHTAVFKKGEPTWKYVDYVPSPVNHKVSLDPYRREGKKVLNIFRSECDLVEKASVDESFMDLGRLVFSKIMSLFPSFLDNMKSTSDKLPVIDKLPEGLDFKGFMIKKDNEAEEEPEIAGENNIYLVEDWDDLVILIGSMICYDLRKKVEENLGYKTSGGVGRVKTIAKLASGYQKPDQQTIIRNDAIPNFLKHFRLTDFWSLGGKTGTWINENLGGETPISTIREHYSNLEDLTKILDKNAELAEKIYLMVRGEYAAPLEDREAVKSMASNKNFRGNSVSKRDDLIPWIRVFVGELLLRIQDTDEEYNSIIRPLKMTLSVLSSSGVRHSKQCTLTQSPKDYDLLSQMYHSTSLALLKHLEVIWNETTPSQKMFPIINACLSILVFVNLSGINTLDELMPNIRKRRVEDVKTGQIIETEHEFKKVKNETLLEKFINSRERTSPSPEMKFDNIPDTENTDNCRICGDKIDITEWQTHQDFHLAVNLESKINRNFEESYGERLLNSTGRNKKLNKKSNKAQDRNQSKLPF